MRQLVLPLRRLVLQFLLLLLLYFLSRLCFTIINARHFGGLTSSGFLRIAFYAIRYDLSGLCAVNALYIILLLLPLPVWRWPAYEKFTQGVFIVSNSLALLFELSDWAYFPYNFKRSTADVLRMIGRKGDFWSVLPSYLLNYWYVPLAAILFIVLLIKANNWIRALTPIAVTPQFRHPWLRPLVQTILLILIAGLTAIGVRGGLQYIPIGLRNAVQIADSRYVPIVLNTPFSIISTLATPSLEEVQYMPDTQAHSLMPFTHQYSGRPFQKKNVVLIILESGSKEFTCLGGRTSFSPFLDSLMGHSLTCTQAFANGQTSAEGIPAIIAGMPTLMDEAFTTSNYGTNKITALPSVLKTQGYSSAFYHGGTNGTMSFDIFTAAAGYDHYYGRTEYNNEADYDGAWGIWDEPFLQYFAHGLSTMRQPFFASVFTLAAHPPYHVPDQYKTTLPKGPQPVHQCMAYTDLAVRRFFATASKQSWYDSTLFIITADHASPQTGGGYYSMGMGQYAIPIIFFCPSDSTLRGNIAAPVQQLDILPSVLDYLGYGAPFFAFGNSIFHQKEEPRYVITQSSNTYQWLQNGHVLVANGVTPKGYYTFPADSLYTSNLLRRPSPYKDSSILHLKAFIQRYRYALIHNALR
jgi:arylsulfatase A-like enzyme